MDPLVHHLRRAGRPDAPRHPGTPGAGRHAMSASWPSPSTFRRRPSRATCACWKHAGLISREVNAHWRLCRLRTPPLQQAHDWLQHYAEHWEHSLDRLTDLVEAPRTATQEQTAMNAPERFELQQTRFIRAPREQGLRRLHRRGAAAPVALPARHERDAQPQRCARRRANGSCRCRRATARASPSAASTARSGGPSGWSTPGPGRARTRRWPASQTLVEVDFAGTRRRHRAAPAPQRLPGAPRPARPTPSAGARR